MDREDSNQVFTLITRDFYINQYDFYAALFILICRRNDMEAVHKIACLFVFRSNLQNQISIIGPNNPKLHRFCGDAHILISFGIGTRIRGDKCGFAPQPRKVAAGSGKSAVFTCTSACPKRCFSVTDQWNQQRAFDGD